MGSQWEGWKRDGVGWLTLDDYIVGGPFEIANDGVDGGGGIRDKDTLVNVCSNELGDCFACVNKEGLEAKAVIAVGVCFDLVGKLAAESSDGVGNAAIGSYRELAEG